ncbi:macrolide ABC transporter ATP-binding protein [Candidatus Micrarchaeota archaeon RBG_16_49_10]|nr:MAG: macrolide ABC transporter ATP-binding protein [Candidatus Micrarchaeota archaeon RBG_16_49_10]
MDSVIKTEGLTKIYNQGEENEVDAVKDINLAVKKGDFVSIIGPSGSGKSTLLHLLGCLDRPTSGKVFIDGIDSYALSDNDLARIRREKIGFVFQKFNLIPLLTAVENVEMPLILKGVGKEKARIKAMEILKVIGLADRANHKPGQLSGGQQQRVAIARSLANDPQIILADEPTGNLDTKTGAEIIKLLKDLNKKGITLVIITHDISISRLAHKQINLKDGKVVGE